MNPRNLINNWFSEDLTDEAAYAIHLFLTEFSQHFEEQYYGHLRRHIQTLKDQHQQQQLDFNPVIGNDDSPF